MQFPARNAEIGVIQGDSMMNSYLRHMDHISYLAYPVHKESSVLLVNRLIDRVD